MSEHTDSPHGELLAKIQQALTHVHDLASGKAKWRMCVPARPGEDSDLVLADALEGARAALSEMAATTPEEWQALVEASRAEGFQAGLLKGIAQTNAAAQGASTREDEGRYAEAVRGEDNGSVEGQQRPSESGDGLRMYYPDDPESSGSAPTATSVKSPVVQAPASAAPSDDKSETQTEIPFDLAERLLGMAKHIEASGMRALIVGESAAWWCGNLRDAADELNAARSATGAVVVPALKHFTLLGDGLTIQFDSSQDGCAVADALQAAAQRGATDSGSDK